MEIIDTIGFDDVVVEYKIAGKVFNLTADPPVEIYWKMINVFQKVGTKPEDIEKIKDFVIDLIVESHYSKLSPFKAIGKFSDKSFLKKNMGITRLNNFIKDYLEVLKKYGVLKNVNSPRTKK